MDEAAKVCVDCTHEHKADGSCDCACASTTATAVADDAAAESDNPQA